MMSPLIPWNAGGAFVISALGLGVLAFRTFEMPMQNRLRRLA